MKNKRVQFIALSLVLGSMGLSLMGVPNWSMSPAQAFFGSHAQEDQRPVMVRVAANWCPDCRKSQGTWRDLQRQYHNQIRFVTLDVTNPHSTEAAKAQATALGLGSWFEQNKTKTSTTALIDPQTNEVIKSFTTEPLPAYQATLNPLLGPAAPAAPQDKD